jgi:hypothetical protein
MAQEAEGWIEWKGGKCPVHYGVLVDVKYRDGGFGHKLPAQEDSNKWRDAESRFWINDGHHSDIIAYRVAKP